MKPAVIMAVVGVNHNGRVDLAREMIVRAKQAGADGVKFQTSTSGGGETSPVTPSKTPGALDLSHEALTGLHKWAQENAIMLLATPVDGASIRFWDSLDMPYWDIPSGRITDLAHLRQIGALGREVLLSVGMSTLEDVAAALDVLEQAGTPRDRVTLLHGADPASPEEANLRVMQTLCRAFPGIAGVGYSDHTEGSEASMAAVAMGATVIEKPFTLDRTLEGPDHRASLEPDELALLASRIRKVEKALGCAIKAPAPSEFANRAVARKSLVARCPIACGEVFTPENVTAKRPGTGLSPMLWDSVMGTRARRDFAIDEILD